MVKHAMTLEARIDALGDFLKASLAKMQLKIPNDEDMNDIKHGPPAVHSAYMPQGSAATKEHHQRAPSITIMPGAISETRSDGMLPVTLALVVWDPGLRTDDTLVDVNGDGWRSLAVLIAEILSKLRAAGDIGGMRFVDDVRSGMYDSHTTDMRPYYVGWIEAKFSYHYAQRADNVNDQLN